MARKMTRRTTLTLQLFFAVLALLALALTLWAIAAFARQWSFDAPARALQELLGSSLADDPLNSFLGAQSGRVVALVLPDQAGQSPGWSIYLPLVTTVVSILGFLTTTWLAWRKERRETAREAMELERLRLEVEALKRRVEQTTPTGAPPASNN